MKMENIHISLKCRRSMMRALYEYDMPENVGKNKWREKKCAKTKCKKKKCYEKSFAHTILLLLLLLQLETIYFRCKYTMQNHNRTTFFCLLSLRFMLNGKRLTYKSKCNGR